MKASDRSPVVKSRLLSPAAFFAGLSFCVSAQAQAQSTSAIEYNWWIAGVVTLVMMQALLIAALLVQRARRAKDIDERKQAQMEMQHLTGQLIHLQDEERKRIARELHDGLGQSLVIIKNRATIGLRDASDADRITEQLEEISSTATAAIDEVHEIAHNLRPYELDRLGLVKALATMVDKLANSSSIQFSADLDEIDGLLSPTGETSVYRIVQEGLNNVVKHAQATKARVSIKHVNGDLILSVSDNGKGLRRGGVSRDGSGLGLAGIAERARLLGGSLAVQSPPSGGTNIVVKLKSIGERKSPAGQNKTK
jgi:signal transduction histidine kinase